MWPRTHLLRGDPPVVCLPHTHATPLLPPPFISSNFQLFPPSICAIFNSQITKVHLHNSCHWATKKLTAHKVSSVNFGINRSQEAGQLISAVIGILNQQKVHLSRAALGLWPQRLEGNFWLRLPFLLKFVCGVRATAQSTKYLWHSQNRSLSHPPIALQKLFPHGAIWFGCSMHEVWTP